MKQLQLAVFGACALIQCTQAQTDEVAVNAAQEALTSANANTLRGVAATSARRVGAAVNLTALQTDATYAAVLNREYSAITPENVMKWGELQTQPGRWNFSNADQLVRFARQHDQSLRGHVLVWHQQLPAFINDSLSACRLEGLMQDHIEHTVEHFRGKLYAWDVVNEAIADDGSGLRDTVFSRKLGDRFIEQAFRAARHEDRAAKLYYNDYGVEVQNPKSDAVLALVQGLKKRRVPIDGVGFQFHLDAASAPSEDAIVANFQRFAALGLNVNVSELDVRVASIPGSPQKKARIQADVYHRVVAACMRVPACDAVTTWGFTDKYTWITQAFGPDSPLPFDANFAPKAAYDGERLAFLGVALPQAPLGPELLRNGDFENGVTDFVTWGATLQSTSTAHDGSLAALVTGRSGAYQGVVAGLPNPTVGSTYLASSFAKAAPGQPLVLTAQVVCADQTNYLRIASATASSSWVPLLGTLTLPSCDLQSVSVYTEGPDPGVDLYVDDMSVREQTPLLGPNVITNSDFESGLAGWVAWAGELTLASDNPHGGSYSARVTQRTDTWQGPVYSLAGRVFRNTSYLADAWVRQDGADGERVSLTVKLTCAGQADQYLGLTQAFPSRRTWQHLTGRLVVPDCELADAAIYVEGPAAGVDVLADDVTLREEL